MKKLLIYIRFIPIVIFYPIFKNNHRLREDVERWIKPSVEQSYLKRIATLLFTFKEFRNLFVYRNRYPKTHRLFIYWVKFWYPNEKTLYIECPDIGGGFYIQHGFATYISAEKIGKNCSVNQQVTIGHNGISKSPVIGNQCMIMCGAKVLGDIELGDCTRVGANAVVIRDYKRGHGTLVGVPAVAKKEISKQVLLEYGVQIDESLFD
jgi:serine O-acetyltransferase